MNIKSKHSNLIKDNIVPHIRTAFWFILAVPFVEPIYFEESLKNIHMLYVYARYASMMAIFLLALQYILRSKKIRIPLVILLVILYYLIIFLYTYFNSGTLAVTVFFFSIKIIALCLLFYIGLRNDAKSFLNGVLILFEILISLNLFIIITHPNGIYNFGMANTYFLFGHRNVMLRYLIYPGICVSLVRSYILYGRVSLRCWMMIFASCLSVVLVWSASSITGMAVFLLYLVVFLVYGNLPKFMSYKYLILVSIAMFVLIVILRSQAMFAFIIEGWLHKNLDFTGRIYLWDAMIYYIQQKGLFGGYGYQEMEVITANILGYSSSHNFFLDMIYEGGLPELLSFFMIVFVVERKLKKYSWSKFSSIFTIVLSAFFIMWNFEPWLDVNGMWMMVMFCFAYYIDLIEKTRLQIEKN